MRHHERRNGVRELVVIPTPVVVVQWVRVDRVVVIWGRVATLIVPWRTVAVRRVVVKVRLWLRARTGVRS